MKCLHNWVTSSCFHITILFGPNFSDSIWLTMRLFPQFVTNPDCWLSFKIVLINTVARPATKFWALWSIFKKCRIVVSLFVNTIWALSLSVSSLFCFFVCYQLRFFRKKPKKLTGEIQLATCVKDFQQNYVNLLHPLKLPDIRPSCLKLFKLWCSGFYLSTRVLQSGDRCGKLQVRIRWRK